MLAPSAVPGGLEKKASPKEMQGWKKNHFIVFSLILPSIFKPSGYSSLIYLCSSSSTTREHIFFNILVD